jgi:hypothetical protein
MPGRGAKPACSISINCTRSVQFGEATGRFCRNIARRVGLAPVERLRTRALRPGPTLSVGPTDGVPASRGS